MSTIEKLLAIVFAIGVVIATVFALTYTSETPYTVYATANDGGYIPVTYYPCEVTEITADTLTVDHNGNLYSCYATETELEVGEIAWCGFAMYEGNLEFIDIK